MQKSGKEEMSDSNILPVTERCWIWQLMIMMMMMMMDGGLEIGKIKPSLM